MTAPTDEIAVDAIGTYLDDEIADPVIRTLNQLARKSRERAARLDGADSPAPCVPEPAPAEPTLVPAPRSRGLALEKRLRNIEQYLLKLEMEGFLVSLPLNPKNEFPTLLTRLPVFRPSRRAHQQKLQDLDNAVAFTTRFGNGKRYGPPLTVRDEDTLIALTRLRSKRLQGRPMDLPIPMQDIYETGKDGRVGVHYVVCTVEQLNRELGLSRGGKNFEYTFQSVKRLAGTRLELNLEASHDRYLGKMTAGRMFSLLEVQWQVYEEQGILIVIFPPLIAQWLEKAYTYIDWGVRQQLTDLGKAIHRFLSSQPKEYRTELQRMADAIGYDGPRKNTRTRFSKALDELVELGWLNEYAWEGSGRNTPTQLTTWRC